PREAGVRRPAGPPPARVGPRGHDLTKPPGAPASQTRPVRLLPTYGHVVSVHRMPAAEVAPHGNDRARKPATASAPAPHACLILGHKGAGDNAAHDGPLTAGRQSARTRRSSSHTRRAGYPPRVGFTVGSLGPGGAPVSRTGR